MEEKISGLIGQLTAMIKEGRLDKNIFGEAENFVLKNMHLANTDSYKKLVEMVESAAQKFGLSSLKKLREGFGLNSCSC